MDSRTNLTKYIMYISDCIAVVVLHDLPYTVHKLLLCYISSYMYGVYYSSSYPMKYLESDVMLFKLF